MASSIAWIAFGTALVFLAYTYVGYPLLTAVLARVASRPVRQGAIEPTVSFLIAAHNEEKDIAWKIEETLALDYPADRREVIVVSDGSTDRTDAIVESYADRGVKLFRPEGHPGKTESANQAVPTTTGEILIFSDATGHYNRECIRALVRNFADPTVGLVSGRVTYQYGTSETASGFRAYQSFVTAARRSEARFGTQTSVSGSIHAIRRELFRPAPTALSFDMVHPLHVAVAGYRTVYEFDATSEEESREAPEAEFRARVRIAVRAFTFLPYLLARLPRCRHAAYPFQMVSHKVLRWLSPGFLLLLAASSLVLAPTSRIAAALFVAQVVVYLLAAVGWAQRGTGRTSKATAVPLFFATINLAFAVGFVRWARGERFGTWTTERA